MMNRKGCILAIVASVGLWAVIVYTVGALWPYDTKGEGPKEENYPW